MLTHPVLHPIFNSKKSESIKKKFKFTLPLSSRTYNSPPLRHTTVQCRQVGVSALSLLNAAFHGVSRDTAVYFALAAHT